LRCTSVALTVILCLTSQAKADAVDDLIRTEMQRHPIPGLTLTVTKNGQAIKTAAYGMADLEARTPVTPDTVFEIGSITKQFTAAAILLLAQDGKLSVDDKIARHLKDTPPSWSQITIRQLLTHTSGLKSYTGLDGFELTRHLTQAQFIQRIGSHPLEFSPGAQWAYCNTGYNLLGFIIENVSGESYWDFLRERILTPLQMTNTAPRAPQPLPPNFACGYETNRAGQPIPRNPDLTDTFSAGALASTVGDLAKWNAALDAEKILTSASRQQLWTPVKLNDGTTHDYGFGWFLQPWQGHANIGHSGSTDGFSASLQRFPDNGLTVIVLCNSDEFDIATKIARKIADLDMKQTQR
jgi:D-alanyl-D-alanine carboxypeptidase